MHACSTVRVSRMGIVVRLAGGCVLLLRAARWRKSCSSQPANEAKYPKEAGRCYGRMQAGGGEWGEGSGGGYSLVFPAKFRLRDKSESCVTDVDVLTSSECMMSSHELVLFHL